MKRRNFLSWSFLSGILTVLVSCVKNQNSDPVNAENKANQAFTSIGTITQLKEKGQIFNEDLDIGAVLVMFRPDNSIVAVNPTCTHAGCTVKWKKDKKAFICPCHGSKFTLEGKVIQGLAKSPLNTYEVKTQGDTILIKTLSSN